MSQESPEPDQAPEGQEEYERPEAEEMPDEQPLGTGTGIFTGGDAR